MNDWTPVVPTNCMFWCSAEWAGFCLCDGYAAGEGQLAEILPLSDFTWMVVRLSISRYALVGAIDGRDKIAR